MLYLDFYIQTNYAEDDKLNLFKAPNVMLVCRWLVYSLLLYHADVTLQVGPLK